MTPERKKKLRILLRKKAAEELKRQQETKATERRRVIAERTGQKENFDQMSESELKAVCKKFHDRLSKLEDEKWDMEYAVSRKELEVSFFSHSPQVNINFLLLLLIYFSCLFIRTGSRSIHSGERYARKICQTSTETRAQV